MDIRLKKYIGMCIVLLALLLIDLFYYFYFIPIIQGSDFMRDNVFLILNIFKLYLIIKIVIYALYFRGLNAQEKYFVKGIFAARSTCILSILACLLLLTSYVFLFNVPFFIEMLPTILAVNLLWTIWLEYKELKKKL